MMHHEVEKALEAKTSFIYEAIHEVEETIEQDSNEFEEVDDFKDESGDQEKQKALLKDYKEE
jgi:hypothetical protein